VITICDNDPRHTAVPFLAASPYFASCDVSILVWRLAVVLKSSVASICGHGWTYFAAVLIVSLSGCASSDYARVESTAPVDSDDTYLGSRYAEPAESKPEAESASYPLLDGTEIRSHCPDTTPDISVRADVLRLLTLNASHGRKTAWNQTLVSKIQTYRNLDLIASLLQETNADIVALQEADAPSRWSGRFDHVDYLRDETEYRCSLIGRHADNWFFTYGTALLSRAQMSNSESITFPPTPPTTSKGFVKTTIAWDVQGKRVPVTIVSVHLDFSRKSVRDEQIGILVEVLKDIESPLIVMGDFNSHWDQKRSHVQQLAEALELAAYEPKNDHLGTYKSTDGKRLDWILASSDLGFARYEVLPDIVSDHFAVYAEIGYRGVAQP
jgi:endonuclease/exonuclease/phosphatase family metal-dependent hydrolase